MAQLEFNIKANFDQIKQAKQELERLRGELQKTTKATDKAVVQDLTDKYAEQKQKVTELSSAMSRYALVMSSDYAKKMQNLTREVYSFELQADASKRKIERISSEIAKMQSKLRKGGLDIGTSTILNRDISENSTILNDEKRRYENLTGLGKQARTELQNMQAEYVRYSGSSNATTDNVKVMTDAFAGMIEEMKKVPTVGEGATSLFNRLGGDAKQLAMSLVGGLGFEQLAEHVFNVRSQFQQLEISFTTMLGSEQKAGALMNQLVQTAAKTPFDMSTITNGAKQLLAYGTAANEVNDILVHLGDISAGLNVPLGDLVYLYGTTMSQGRMYTMDLRQFMGRGIPMAEELGKIMGKTTQEVQQAVTDGKVGADLVKKAIINMTEEGGKFGGLMEKQSTTLQGKWSNIGDSVDQMFNELGKKSQGIFGTGLDLISSLVDNWETVVKVIGSAAVAVGTYKAGLMAAASIQKAQNQATLDSIASNLDEKIKAYKDEAELYHSYTGKDTSEYKSQRLSDLNKAVSNTDMLGTDKAEELVSLKIKEAQTDGIITQQMAEQLQLKRDMLVTQQQSAAKEQMEALELSKGLDEKMAQFKEMENDYRHLNGKDTKDYKASRYNELGNALSDTENIGDDETEKRISKQIELAKSEGLISDEMAKQLQLKRDLLVEQTKLAEKEQLQWQNAVNAKEAAEEELRAKKSQEADIAAANKAAEQAKAEADLKQKIAKANETAYGKALLETNALQKKVDLQQESYDKAMDEAREKRIVLAQLDEEIKKQQQIIEQKEKELVYDNGAVDTTSFGGYADSFSDNENSSIVQYEAEQAKLEELMQKRQQADEEYESSNAKRKAIQQELQTTTEKLTEAEENETEVYKETGAAADEIGDIVQQGIDIEDGKISITEAATTATQTNTTSEASNATAKGANANATSSETIANSANSTSKTANTAATNVNTASENVNTGAKERNSLVTSILSVGTKGLALAQNVLTWATNAVTVSMRELWAAMLANPLTTIITLVTTAMSVFAMFGSEEEDAAKKTQDMGNKAAEASNKVRSLFAVLNNGKAEDHKDAINELKSAYEEYGIKLDETKMKSQSMSEQADELKAHEEELIGIIEKRSLEMERANQLQEAYNNYNSSNDSSFGSFKDSIDDKLSDVEMGTIRSLISQDDIDKLAELRKEMNACGGDLKVYNALNAQYSQLQGELNVKIGTYLENMHHSRSEVAQMIPDINDFTDGLVSNKVELDGTVDSINNSVNAAERARKATSKLTYAQEEQALKNQYAKNSFKDLNSEIQETIKLCSRKLHLDIKVNYDDSELPAWIKNMSQSQLKASMAVRKNWLDGHKKGDVLQVGGQYKTYEQVANELAMMQARGNNIESKPKKSQKEIEKERKAREKEARDAEKARNDAETKAGNKRKAEEDYAKSISSYSEKASDELSKRRMELIKNETEKEIAQINMSSDKEKKAIEDSIDKLVEAKKKKDQIVWVNSGKGRKANMWKQEKSDAKYRKEVLGTQMVDDKGNHLGKTIGQNSEDQIALIEERRQLKLKEIQQAEVKEMLDFLKQYGTYQEKKYAIAKEYDEKINLETNTYKKASLEKEKSKAISDVDASSLQSQIDWQSVFGSMIGSLQEQLKETFQGLKEYTKTDDFKKKDATEQKVIYEAIDKMRGALTGDHEGTLNLSKLKRQSEDLGNAFKEMQAAGLREKIAFDNLQVAQDSYEKALKTGDKAQIKGASQTLDSAKAIYDSAKNTSEEMVKTVKAKGVEYKESSQGTLDGLNEVASGLKEFSGGSLSGLMSGLTNTVLGLSKLDLGKTLNKSVSKLADKLQSGGNIGQIISAILSILDILKDGIGSLVANVIDTILNAVNGILKNILTGKSVEQIGGSLLEGVGNILDTVTFGGLSSWLGDGSSDKNLEKDLSRLSESNNNLKTSIDALADKMDEASSMQDITTSYEKQKAAIQDQIKNTQESMYRSGEAYTKGHWYKAYTDGKHSSNKKINDAMSSGDWDKVSKAAGISVRSASDFWNLTSEQMANVAAYAATQYDKIKQYGDDGYKNASQYMDSYIEYYKELEQLENSYREKLTSISFDSVESDFKSMLENMDSDSTDFADSFQKKMASAIINSLMVNKYKQRLQDWYKTFSSTFENKNLTKEELYKAQEKLKQKYMAISKDALDERDSLKDALGWNDNFSQSASSGSFESMSQDTGNELNGRFTAVQIATEGTYEEIKLINTKLDAIAARDGGAEGSLLTASVNTIMGNVGNIWLAVDEGRTILAQSLMYLQSIDERQERWHKPMLQAFNDIHELKDKMSRL